MFRYDQFQDACCWEREKIPQILYDCYLIPLRLLRSRKTLFDERGAFTSAPRGAGPAPALVGFAVRSDGRIGDECLYLHPHRSDLSCSPRLEACAADTRSFSYLPRRRLMWKASTMFPLVRPNTRSLWMWSLVPWQGRRLRGGRVPLT